MFLLKTGLCLIQILVLDRCYCILTYSHLTNTAKELSIFSIGGHWKHSTTSVASDALIPFFSSHRLNASFTVVALD